MADSCNESGMFCSSSEWLEAHHRAKLPERRAFAERLAAQQPKRLVDLGCGVGLWLELLDDLLPSDCEFIGIDVDDHVLDQAAARACDWDRSVTFKRVDLNRELNAVPSADITLAFNVFSFVDDPAGLIESIATKGSSLAVRQYDGAAIRFGPMNLDLRSSLERSLHASFADGEEPRHYDLDRLMPLLAASQFSKKEMSFELFARAAPYPDDFLAYYNGFMSWTLSRLSNGVGNTFRLWLDAEKASAGRYFFEVDLVAVLSQSNMAQRQRCSN